MIATALPEALEQARSGIAGFYEEAAHGGGARTIGQTMDLLRQCLDLRDALASMDKLLAEVRSKSEKALLDYQEMMGVSRLATDGLTVSFDPNALRAKYDPEKWDGVMKWAVETGNTHIIQRRLTDARVEELIRLKTALPEGLSVETYTKISVRRK